MRGQAWLSLGLSAAVLALDQWSKAWARAALPHLGRYGLTIVPGCFNLAYAENVNAAFGILEILPYPLRRIVLTAFAAAAVVVLIWALVTGRIQRPWTLVATGLILGGALGNVIDRMRLGFVVDFIVWHVGDRFYWPTFNVADSGIVVGVFMLLWLSYRSEPGGLASPTPPDPRRASGR